MLAHKMAHNPPFSLRRVFANHILARRAETTPVRPGSIAYPGNLSLLLDRALDRFPDRAGIGFQHAVLSFREYHDRVCRVTHGLNDLGIERGDRVLLLSRNSLSFALIVHAVLRVGAVLVPVNPGIRPHELSHIVAETRPRFAFAEARALPRLFKTYELLPSQSIPKVVTIEEEVPPAVHLRDIDVTKTSTNCEQMKEGELAMIVYTAAMEGYALGAELTHGSLFHDAVCAADACFDMSDTSREAVSCLLPLYHCHGLTSGFLVPLAGGVTTYPMDPFQNTDEVLRVIGTHGITLLTSVPSVYEALLRPLANRPEIWPQIKGFVTGGAPAPVKLIEQYGQRLGISLLEGYGLTEASPTVTWNPSHRTPRAGAVGPPLPCCQIKILDDHGAEVPSGVEGEVVVRGLNLFRGYHRQPEKTAKVLDADGWFKTGDFGFLDGEGDLTWTGLKKDMINIFGQKVYPREVERLLLNHPDLDRIRIYSEKHDRYGEVVACDLWPKPGKTITEVLFRRWARQTVSSYKIPRRIRVRR